MKISRGRLVQILIAAACVGWLAYTIYKLGPRTVLAVARQADATWLALSFVPIFGRFVIWGFKWNGMLRRRGPISYPNTLRALLAGVFVNLTTPTAKLAGGFVRAALVNRRTGWGMAQTYGWSLADQITNVLGNLSLYGLLAVSAGYSMAAGVSRGQLLASGVVALATVVIVVSLRARAWVLFQKPGLARVLARVTPARYRTTESGRPMAGWVRPVFEPLLHHGRTIVVAPRDLALGAASFGTLCIANAMVLQALGADAHLAKVSVAVVVGYFFGTIFGTLGGIGVTEVALVELYTLAGVSREVAAAGALLHRASYYLVILLWGGVSLALEGRGFAQTNTPETIERS
ncbi:MAG: lysylphosphatidylglycerol synthase transmembrane domain-containing protein [Acidobacteriota bacterium]|nr:lysylphosphatidylglycerol synthase transmembrane domain-containing protein [Acidobacteriota bacterium]